MLQSLAVYAVTAIQEMRLLNAVEEAARRIISQPCAPVLEHLAEAACDLLNAPASAVWLRREEELVLAASAGGQHSERIPLRESLARAGRPARRSRDEARTPAATRVFTAATWPKPALDARSDCPPAGRGRRPAARRLAFTIAPPKAPSRRSRTPRLARLGPAKC